MQANILVTPGLAAKAGGPLMRPRVKPALDRITGLALVALGLRLATEPH